MNIPPFLRILLAASSVAAADSLPPLQNEAIPQTLQQLWGDYDPRKEPLESETHLEWEQDGLVCRVIRYRIGTFKGQPARMAAFFAFPKGATQLPAILQIHGGGQSASLSAVTTYAKLGYAALSLNWGGNKMTLPEGKTYAGPNTDWGALDATHPPQRNKTNHFVSSPTPDAFTLDPVLSPRNDNWFVVTLGTRRALTFLELQPEVDPTRLGVTGHSMGGRLTTMLTAIDSRVKTAVPSCGGSGDFTADPSVVPGGTPSKRTPLELATISENPYIEQLRVPTLWLSPTNDFHAHIDHFAYTWRDVPDALLGLSISPHFNHRHTDAHTLTATLWFEQQLKGAITLPRPPALRLQPKAKANGAALFTVTPDPTQPSAPIETVRVYASSDSHALTRFWRTAELAQEGNHWVATVPVLNDSEPLFAYADVFYKTPEPYRNIPTPPGVGQSPTFALSSRVLALPSSELRAAGVRASAQRDRLIDPGTHGWQDWFRLNWGNPSLWSATTRKVKDPLWRGPRGAQLGFEINPANDCTLYVRLTRNSWGAFGPGTGEYYAAVPLKAQGHGDWQPVALGIEAFQPVNPQDFKPLEDWSTLTELTLSGSTTVLQNGAKQELTSAPWKNPTAIRLRHLRWIGGEYQGDAPVAAELSEAERTKAFNDAIKASLEQEKRDGPR